MRGNCPLETGLRPCECDLPRCPVCNYTRHDAAFEMDHATCSGTIPESDLAAARLVATGVGDLALTDHNSVIVDGVEVHAEVLRALFGTQGVCWYVVAGCLDRTQFVECSRDGNAVTLRQYANPPANLAALVLRYLMEPIRHES